MVSHAEQRRAGIARWPGHEGCAEEISALRLALTHARDDLEALQQGRGLDLARAIADIDKSFSPATAYPPLLEETK